MRPSYRVCRIFGVSVELHITFLLLFLLLFLFAGLLQGFVTGLVVILIFSMLFLIVLLHELSHSLAAKLSGLKVGKVVLWPLGGLATIQLPERPDLELVITTAGPALNFGFVVVIIIGLSLMLPGGLAEATAMVRTSAFEMTELLGFRRTADPAIFFNPLALLLMFCWINAFLGAFNLLPGFPMDGGRIFRAILAFFTDYLTSTQIAVRVGQLVAIFFVCIGILVPNLLLTLVGILLLLMGGAELQFVKLRHWLSGLKVRSVAQPLPVVHPSMRVKEFFEVVAKSAHRHYALFDGELRGVVLIDSLAGVKPEKELREYATSVPVVASNAPLEEELDKLIAHELVVVIDPLTGEVEGYVTPELLAERAAYFRALRGGNKKYKLGILTKL